MWVPNNRSWRESLFVNYRSTSLQTAFFLNFNPDLKGIIPQSQLYYGYCPTFSPQLTRGRFRFLLCSTLVPHLTLWIIRSCWTGCPFRTEYRILRSTGCKSFIVGRTQTVHYGGSVSRCAQLRSGIAQGSVLGPILYVPYTADVQKLVESFGFRVHLYADDTQFHDSCKSTDAAELAARAMRVIEAVRDWMSSNRLRLNADKTQFIWLGTNHFLDVLQINSIPANEVVNNLGVYFDPELLMERQVNKLCQVCYFHLRRFENGSPVVNEGALLTLVHAFVTSRVDHYNGVLYGSNGYLLDRLQSVLNSAARLILGVPKFDSVSAAIRNELHWLPIGKRIQFKIALLVRHCIVGAAPEYLIELCRPVSSSSGRQSLRSASRGDLIVPRFRLRRSGYTGFLLSLGPTCGTRFRPKLDNRVTIYYSSRVN